MSEQTFDTWTNPLFLYADRGGRQSFYGLLRMMEDGHLLVPEYQRGRVWTDDQRRRWVGYVLSGAPLPAIFIRQVNAQGPDGPDGPDGLDIRDELLDGQQRMTALLSWAHGEIDAVIPWSGEVVRCESHMDRRRLDRIACPVVTLPPATNDAEAIRLYLDLNTAGTPHTDDDLAPALAMLAKAEAR